MGHELTLEVAHTQGFELVCEHSARFTAYVGSLAPDDLGRAVPGSDWTVGEVITHVRSVYERYTIDTTRSSSPTTVGEQNARDVTRLGIDVDAAIESIDAQVEQLATVVPLVDPAHEFPFHSGMTVTLAGGWGNLLGELLAHGDDIARATGTSFGIPSADLEIVPRFTMPLLGGWLSPDANAVDESWDLEYPFGRIRMTIAEGTVQVEAAAHERPANHTIEIEDTAEWLLTFPYRRRPPTDDVVAHLVDQFVPT